MPSKPVAGISKKQTQIVETAEFLFTRHGIKRISVEEICRQAGVSKMTFYNYFANKTELVKYIWNSWMEEGFSRFEEINAMDMPFPEKLELMFAWKKELLSKMSTEFIEEVLPIDIEMESVMQRFHTFIVEAQRKGDIRAEIHPEFLLAVLDKVYQLARDDDLRKGYPSIIEFNRELKDFFWFGVVARPQSEGEAQ